jgi:DNA polymerase-3 subunit delta'
MSSSSSILGHRLELAALQEDIRTGNVSHAYLFTGPRHVGKFTVAKWFATELLTAGVEEANKERARVQAEKLLHPDLFALDQLWIEGVAEDADMIARSSNIPQQHRMKAKAKTDTISIEDIRMLQERLHEVGTGKYRCCLIRSVERMQDEAVNALLKILEEPPPGVVFLLTTQAMQSLLPTLVSRARVMRFSRVRDSDMEPLLQNASDADRRFVLQLAQGAPGIVRSLLADPEVLRAEKTAFANALAFWRASSLAQRLRLLTPIHERGEESDQFILHLAIALREEQSIAAPRGAEFFHRLLRGLETNTSRQMLSQQFALAL